jgi:DNA mismatch repair ATPase MutS
LRQWFLQPILDLTIIESRFETIEFFQDSQFENTVEDLRKNIKDVKDISRIVKRMQEGTSSVNDWNNFQKTLLAYNNIFETFNEIKELDEMKKVPILHKVFLF